ncbi:MAG TPA: hypothetical protein ENN78_00005, partial [Candidatus Omnitrophica bacterium]|nr:hypothetical protein [Candidatus Omnitrophota bacterium]
MRDIEMSKGGLTLCTNSLLQGILIAMFPEGLESLKFEGLTDITQDSVSLEGLHSRAGSRLTPSAIREILKYSKYKDLIYLAGGVPDPTTFPVRQFNDILSGITPIEWGLISRSNDPNGLEYLRQVYARWFNDR